MDYRAEVIGLFVVTAVAAAAPVLAGPVEVVRAFAAEAGAGDVGGASVPAAAGIDHAAAQRVPVAEPVDGMLRFQLQALIAAGGADWLARGTDESGRQWIFRNGSAAAFSGGPITLNPGETERFRPAGAGAVFFAMHGNVRGDVVVGGRVEVAEGGRAGDGERQQEVLVLNSQRVLVRTGDEVEAPVLGSAGEQIDAGGSMGELRTMRIVRFVPESVRLSDDGWCTFIAELGAVDHAGSTIAGVGVGGTSPVLAQVRVAICPVDFDGSGALDRQDLSAFMSAWMASVAHNSELADFNRDGVVNTADVSAFLAEWMHAAEGACER